MSRFVAYCYQVSTETPGRPDPGLDAQRAAVAGFVASRGTLLAECVEVASRTGKSGPALTEALDLCRREAAILVIAELAPFARDGTAIAALLDCGVEFVALDMPQADRPLLCALATVARQGREAASRRIKEALAAARARGVRLGNPAAAAAAAKGRATLATRAALSLQVALPQALALRDAGLSLRCIAATLNARNVAAPRGRRWHASTIATLLRQATAAATLAPADAAHIGQVDQA